MAKNQIAKRIYLAADGSEVGRSPTESASVLVFEFANGQTLRVEPGQFPEIIQHCAMLNGLSQKIGDAFAGAEDVADAYAQAEAMLAQLQDGTWANRSGGGTGGSVRIPLVVAAVAALTGADEESVYKTWDGMDEETRKSVQRDPNVKAKVAQIKAEREKAKAEKTGGGFDFRAAFGG